MFPNVVFNVSKKCFFPISSFLNDFISLLMSFNLAGRDWYSWPPPANVCTPRRTYLWGSPLFPFSLLLRGWWEGKGVLPVRWTQPVAHAALLNEGRRSIKRANFQNGTSATLAGFHNGIKQKRKASLFKEKAEAISAKKEWKISVGTMGFILSL